MHFDWLEKIPACKICTNKRNAGRYAIIRLSSNGKASAEFKLISNATHKTVAFTFSPALMARAEAWGQLCVVFSPPSSCMKCSVSSSTSAFSMETSRTFLVFSCQASIGEQCNEPPKLKLWRWADYRSLTSVCSCTAGCGITAHSKPRFILL